MPAEHVLTPDDKCPCGKPQEGSGYCSYECYSKHDLGAPIESATSLASMGGPLSETDQLRAENASLSDQLDQVHAELAETRKALDSCKASHRDYIDASKAYCKDVEQQRDAAQDLVGVLEGQLATARERHVRERRYTCPDGEGTWGSAEECAADCDIPVESVEHFDICAHCGDMETHDDEWRCYDWSQWPCADAADLGLDGGDSEEETPHTIAPDSPMDEFEAADDIDRRWE